MRSSFHNFFVFLIMAFLLTQFNFLSTAFAKSAEADFSVMLSPQAIGSQISRNISKRKTEKELMFEKNKSDVTNKKNADSIQLSPKKDVFVPPPPPTPVNQNISEISLQVQRIMDTNKRIQSLQLSQVNQLQKINEQRGTHIGAIEKYEKMPNPEKNNIKKISKNVLFAQESLREEQAANDKDYEIAASIGNVIAQNANDL